MSSCVICGSRVISKRSNVMYCSSRCKVKAYRQRQQAMKSANDRTLDMNTYLDLRELGEISHMTMQFAFRINSICGKELAEEFIDAAWDLATRLGFTSKARS